VLIYQTPNLYSQDLPGPDSAAPQSPQGTVENPFSFPLSQVKPTQLAGGTVKVVDSTTFKASVTIAAAGALAYGLQFFT